jgi:hypothetical protein
MNCELELIGKYIRKEYPYIVSIKNIEEISPSISGTTFTSYDVSGIIYLINICINENFYNQLENNNPLKSNIISSLNKELARIIKSICPEMNVTNDNLEITFHQN